MPEGQQMLQMDSRKIITAEKNYTHLFSISIVSLVVKSGVG
jgi:hypothetical protein